MFDFVPPLPKPNKSPIKLPAFLKNGVAFLNKYDPAYPNNGNAAPAKMPAIKI